MDQGDVGDGVYQGLEEEGSLGDSWEIDEGNECRR